MPESTKNETDDARSLRADVAELALAPDHPRAEIYNSAISDVLELLDRYEHARQQSVKRAIAARRSAGKKVGGDLPYGFRLGSDDETLQPDRKEQRIITAARQLRAEGHSLREVARRLKDKGFTPREGESFHASQIKRIVDVDV